MENFRDEYIKIELNSKSKLNIASCGIYDNIISQWENNRSKAVGLFNNEQYFFGASTDFGNDHIYIINEMEKLLGKARFMVTIYEDCGKIHVGLRQTHRGIKPVGLFETRMIKMILSECLEAFENRPNGTKMTIDVGSTLLYPSDKSLLRVKDAEGIKRQIAHVARPSILQVIKDYTKYIF